MKTIFSSYPSAKKKIFLVLSKIPPCLNVTSSQQTVAVKPIFSLPKRTTFQVDFDQTHNIDRRLLAGNVGRIDDSKSLIPERAFEKNSVQTAPATAQGVKMQKSMNPQRGLVQSYVLKNEQLFQNKEMNF
jgi:hypothetical protein